MRRALRAVIHGLETTDDLETEAGIPQFTRGCFPFNTGLFFFSDLNLTASYTFFFDIKPFLFNDFPLTRGRRTSYDVIIPGGSRPPLRVFLATNLDPVLTI